ncbi:hypothetical protein ACIRD8_27685 [Streptomyces sp. NPDC102451]|uniref:hypothetical protein n=1 Tax=Streptomyces sp. NPDC102451 TaxID=3366177 RepID=UPI0038099A3D
MLVLVLRALPDVPSLAMLKRLDRYAARLTGRGGRLVLCGVRSALVHLLERSGLATRLGDGGIVPATKEMFGDLDTAYADARRSASKNSSERPPSPR